MRPQTAGRALVIHHLRTDSKDAAAGVLEEAGFLLGHRYSIDGNLLPDTDEGQVRGL